ncbi:MAG: tetratricopeptide repeat protein [Puniceicoccaceae bacterium]
MDIVNFLLSGSSLLILLLQIACIVHVIRESRPFYWIFLIFFFPMIGIAIYFFMEILPGLKERSIVRSLGQSKKAGGGELRKLKEAANYSDTVENKLKLADAHLSREEFSEASRLYSDCMTGIYARDPVILHHLAEAKYGENQYKESRELLLQLKEMEYKDYQIDREFLLALCYKHLDEKAKAIRTMKSIAGRYPGEEARYELGVLYAETGDKENARLVFEEVIGNRGNYRKASIGSQRKWVSLARKELGKLPDS